MFDTLYFSCSWSATNNHPDWNIRRKAAHDLKNSQDLESGAIRARHNDLNIRAYGPAERDGPMFTKVEVPSLSALLHGKNGMPLNGQDEVDAALEVLDRLLGQIAEPREQTKTFREVHTSLNLHNLPYQQIEVALQRAKLPGARKATIHYVGQSLTFRRAKTKLQFYDKVAENVAHNKISAEDAKRLAPFARVELRLEKEDLEKAMGDGLPVTELNTMTAYRALREHILSLGLTHITGVDNKDSFLARVGTERPELLDLYFRTCLSNEYGRKKRKQIAAMMPLVADEPVDWDKVLPVDHPPLETQLYIPGDLKGTHRELVEEVRTRRGMGLGPHHIHEAHAKDP